MKICFLFVLASVCFSLTTPVAAQVYKWVDEKGVTHYGQRPPQGQNAQSLKLTLPTGPAPAPPKPDASQHWHNEDLEFQKRRIEREQQALRQQAQAQEKQRRCAIAQDDLRQMTSVDRLYDLNEKGERVFLDDAARRAAIERMNQAIADNCS